MARIVHGGGTANTVSTLIGGSNFIAGPVAYHIWNSGAEAIKLTMTANNDFVMNVTTTNAEASKHTGNVLSTPVNGNALVIDAGGSVHMTISPVTLDTTNANNTVVFTTSGVHTDVGLEGNIVYLARIVTTAFGFESNL